MPDWRSELVQRLSPLRLSPAREASVMVEIEQHLEQHYADLLDEGVPEETARKTVLADLDNYELLRDLRNAPREELPAMLLHLEQVDSAFWSRIGFDVRYGLRQLRKNRGFAAVALLTLGVGLGANTAVFSLVHTLLLRPIFPGMERILVLEDTPAAARGQKMNMTYRMSYPKYLAWKQHTDIFESVAAVRLQGPSLTGLGEPERLSAALVSSDFLPMLGITPALGRGFRPEEEPISAAPVVLLSYPFWRSHFNSNPGVVGGKLTLNDKVFTIIGVLPETARLGPGILKMTGPLQFDVVEPLREDPAVAIVGFNHLVVLGKVHPGLQTGSAISAIQSQQQPINAQFGTDNDIQVIPFQTFVMADTRPLLLILLGAVATVLLITCANTANLLLARGTAREKEIAIRVALGASRNRLLYQLLTESLLISLFGAMLGLAGMWATQSSLTNLLADRLPPGTGVHLNGPVVAFAFALAVVTGIVFGMVPAFQSSGREVRERLNQAGRLSGAAQSQKARSIFVVAEIALSLALLAAAGLLLRSFVRLQNVDKGFDTDHLLTLRIWPSPTRYQDPRAYIEYTNTILEQTQALPGVQYAGWISNLPLYGNNTNGGFMIQGRPMDDNMVMGSKQLVAGDYFRAMHMRLLRGRLFNERDNTKSPPVALIDEGFARQYFGADSPLGKHINFGWGGTAWAEIVGVVGEVKEMDLSSAPMPTVYVPLAQKPALLEGMALSLAVRTSVDPAGAAQSIRDVVHRLDSTQIIESVRTMDKVIDDSLSTRRAPLWLFGGFGVIALFLAAIGVYGVLAYYVAQRREEIGVRLAMGAQRRDILRLVMGHAGKLVFAGLVVGAGITFAVVRTLSSQLYGTSPTDGPTLLAAAAILATVALIACGVPAFRATRVDPQVVLRSE